MNDNETDDNKENESKKVSLTPQEEEKIIQYVYECKTDSLSFYENKFKSFNFFDHLYMSGGTKTNVNASRANLELPLAFQQVESFVSQMTETMVGESPYIQYTGRTPDDDQPAEQITDFTQYQLETGGFLSAWVPWIRNVGKYGNAVLKINWETDLIELESEEQIPQIGIDPQTGSPFVSFITQKKTEEYKKHEGPRFYNRSIFDFFVPRGASSCDVQKMSWVIDRVYRNLEDLLDNPLYARAHDQIKYLLENNEEDHKITGDGGTALDTPKRTDLSLKNPAKGLSKYKGQVEILEYWGEYRKEKGEKAEQYIIAVAVVGEEKLLLRFEENPLSFKFKPFIMSNDYAIEGEPYGYGELHHIKGLIQESTALRNARLDVANLSLNRVWLVERQAGVNLRELYTAPNKIILTNDLNGIRPMEMGQVTVSSVNELARIDFDIQNTTEIINPRQDVSNVGAAFGSTATGVNFLVGKSNLRLLTKARLLQEQFFKPLADILNWMNRDLVTDDMYYRLAGEDIKNPYRSVSPDAFLRRVDYKPTSSPDKLKMAEKKDSMAYFLQTLGQVVKVKPNININFEELIKDMAKTLGFARPEKYIGPSTTTVVATPQGQLMDTNGQPVNVMQVDESGNPIQPVQQ